MKTIVWFLYHFLLSLCIFLLFCLASAIPHQCHSNEQLKRSFSMLEVALSIISNISGIDSIGLDIACHTKLMRFIIIGSIPCVLNIILLVHHPDICIQYNIYTNIYTLDPVNPFWAHFENGSRTQHASRKTLNWFGSLRQVITTV